MIVSLHKPFSIELQLLEVEHRYPSIRMNVKIVDDRFAGEIFFSKEIWFDGTNWEEFIAKLDSLHSLYEINDGVNLSLSDMDRFFLLRIFESQEKIFISISFERNYKAQKSGFSVEGEIDGDMFSRVQIAFAELASAVQGQ